MKITGGSHYQADITTHRHYCYWEKCTFCYWPSHSYKRSVNVYKFHANRPTQELHSCRLGRSNHWPEAW